MAIGALTAIAFVLRLQTFGESLFGDELFAYDEVHGHSLGQVLHNVTGGQENSPPLYFVLAWAAIKLGDPTVLIRLPSLVFGTAVIPLVYLLGRRTVGHTAGLIGAALTALSPLAVYFSVEARPYALVMFLLTASTVVLLQALDSRRLAWWVLYGAVSAAALYTHYTAVAVLAVQFAWAVWTYREQLRDLVLVHTAVVVAFLPWIPGLAEQRRGAQDLDITGAIFPLSIDSFARTTAQLLPGYERQSLGDVPGGTAMGLFGAAVVLGLVGGIVAAVRRRGSPISEATPASIALVAGLALATPVCILLYSLFGADIYTPRHLLASLPALALLLGLLFAALPRVLMVAAVLMAFSALTLGLVRAFDSERSRPPLKEAARFIDVRADPGDPVLEYVFLAYRGLFSRHLQINFEQSHPFDQTGFVSGPDPGFWHLVARAPRLFVVEPWTDPPLRNPLPEDIARRFGVASTKVWPGSVPVAVLEYRAR